MKGVLWQTSGSLNAGALYPLSGTPCIPRPIPCLRGGVGASSGRPGRLGLAGGSLQARPPVLDLAFFQAPLQGAPPGWRQRQRQALAQQLGVGPPVEQHLGQAQQRPVRMAPFDQLQDIASRHHAFLQHPVVPAGAPGLLHPQGHPGDLEAVVELPAGHAPLGHFQQRGPGPHAVAEADVGFAPAAGAEVLAEGARLHQQGVFAQFGDPGGVVFAWVMVDRFLDAAMDAQVALFVAFQADGGDPERTVARRLGDAAARAGAGEGPGAAGEKGIQG